MVELGGQKVVAGVVGMDKVDLQAQLLHRLHRWMQE